MPSGSSSTPSYGIAIPQIGSTVREPRAIAKFAGRSQELGFDTLWVSELATAPIIDPLILLATAAAHTERARLGVAVVLVPLRIPIQLARELASLDILSGGRLTVGVGLGSKPDIYPRYGLSPERRLRRYLDALELLRLLWTQDEVSFDGDWQLEGPAEVPRPVQSPHPPLWFGARQDAAVRRAASRGDGWIGSGIASIGEFSHSLGLIHERLEQLERDPTQFVIAKRIYLAVSDGDPGRDRDRMREWFGANYGNPELADEMAIVGGPEEAAEGLGELREAGVQHMLLNPVFDELEQAEALAGEVIPQLD